MPYYCVKCKRKHLRGSIFEKHQIYDQINSIEITQEIKDNAWIETCYDCTHRDKMFDQGGTVCNLLENEWEKYYKELSSFGWSFHQPKAAFRVPRTSEIYRKCKYWNKKEE